MKSIYRKCSTSKIHQIPIHRVAVHRYGCLWLEQSNMGEEKDSQVSEMKGAETPPSSTLRLGQSMCGSVHHHQTSVPGSHLLHLHNDMKQRRLLIYLLEEEEEELRRELGKKNSECFLESNRTKDSWWFRSDFSPVVLLFCSSRWVRWWGCTVLRFLCSSVPLVFYETSFLLVKI